VALAATGTRAAPLPGPRFVAHHAGARRVASATGAAPTPRLFRTRSYAVEPTIGVTARGVWVQAVGWTGDRPGSPSPVGGEISGRVLHAPLPGGPFTDESPAAGGVYTHVHTFDPELYVDEGTGRIFTTDLVIPCMEMSYRDDAPGSAWTTSVVGCEQTDHQTVFAGRPVSSPTVGYPNVVYMCAMNGGVGVPSSAFTSCLKSLDGGTTFVLTGTAPYTDDPTRPDGDLRVRGACNGATGHGTAGPDGTVYLPRGWCGQPWLAISHDEGATWTRVQVARNGMGMSDEGVWDHKAGVAVDAAGTVYYTWVAYDRRRTSRSRVTAAVPGASR
jgi:hypothetical protein